MADVLLARTDGIEGFARHVVLKRIREEYARDPHFIKMFLDEARVAANLHHQHIVQVNDIGEANGHYFFAMEYLHGEDVRALLSAASKARTHVPLGVVAAIGSAAAAGLHYAHERRANDKRPLNIVHCDVSPSNILIGYDGSIKVVDFGIAKAALRSDDSRYLKGKAAYMSPEQCTGGPIDRRSDVFSLGIVLYELATTTRLFKGASDALVMDAIVKGRAPLPRVRRADLPNELSMIIMRALDTDPNRRYQTADELRVALDRFAEAAGLNTSAAAVASVLKKMFGDRPEPWLDRDADADDARTSWTELSQLGSGRAHRPSDLAAGTDRFGPVHARASAPTMEASPPARAPELEPAASPPAPSPGARRGRTRQLAIGAAALAAAGAVVIAVAASGGDPETVPAAAATRLAAPTPAVAAQAAASSEPGRAMTVVRPSEAVEGADPAGSTAPGKPAPEAAANASAARRVAVASSATRSAPSTRTAGPAAPASAASTPPARTASALPAPVPAAPEAPTPPPVAEVATAPSTPSPAPAPPAAPAIAAPAQPAAPTPTAAPSVPQLPQGIINRVAWDHSKELAQCDDKESGTGEVTVRFHVAADGRVTKPQIATAMGKPKLAACILRSLQKWRFPRQPASGAQGSYTIIF